MKHTAIVFSTHAAPTLKHLIKEASDRGQKVAPKTILGFNPSEAIGIDMTPKAKPFRKMSVKEQVQARETLVPGSLDSILAAVDMGDE